MYRTLFAAVLSVAALGTAVVPSAAPQAEKNGAAASAERPAAPAVVADPQQAELDRQVLEGMQEVQKTWQDLRSDSPEFANKLGAEQQRLTRAAFQCRQALESLGEMSKAGKLQYEAGFALSGEVEEVEKAVAALADGVQESESAIGVSDRAVQLQHSRRSAMVDALTDCRDLTSTVNSKQAEWDRREAERIAREAREAAERAAKIIVGAIIGGLVGGLFGGIL